MKNTFTKKELKEIIKEVIQERWTYLFRPSSEPEHQLFTTIDKWMDEMLDDAGHYIGPELEYPFKKGEFLQILDRVSYDTLEIIEKWNHAYGRKYGKNQRDISTANKLVRQDLYTNHPEAIIGTFPNQ